MNTRRAFTVSLGAGALAACAQRAAPPPTFVRPMWPLPPEQPRWIFEATLRNAASLRDGAAPRMQRLLTGDDDAQASFSKPLGVAAGGGRVYVSDTEGRRIFVFDIPRRRTFSFGTRLDGQLKKPAGIALDALGRVYVVDSTARKVLVYDALGLFLGALDGHDDWLRPTAVAVRADGRRIHVVDTGGVDAERHRVCVHDPRGALLRTIGGERGDAPGRFNLPADAAMGPDGTLWVLDAGNFRVQAFDESGRPLRQFGSVGNGLGQFARPRGLAVSAEGLVHVADALLCNVQVFQPDGQLLLALGARAERHDAPGRWLLPARLACDDGGHLYVVDQYLHKIDVLRRLGEAEGRALMPSA
ncbi:MAG TPA: 6-bladed beta-propeller [Burkholderiaceae bacterium]|nr:6-bladed beta-propeller [Burkholderiaceae bacterium]